MLKKIEYIFIIYNPIYLRMIIFLRFPNDIEICYQPKSDAIIKDIYRFIRDNKNISIDDFFLISQCKKITYDMQDKISDCFSKNTIIMVNYRLCAGPVKSNTEELNISIDLPDRKDQITLNMNPDNTIEHTVHYIIEYLDKKQYLNIFEDDVELVHNNNILHPQSQLAKYATISRTYIHYIKHQEFRNGCLKLIVNNNNYYGYEVIGKKIEPVPKLILRIKTQELPTYDEKCSICLTDMMYNNTVTLPYCRHRFCKICLDKYIKEGNIICPICRQDI